MLPLLRHDEIHPFAGIDRSSKERERVRNERYEDDQRYHKKVCRISRKRI
jgi:hypothetical protein